MRLMPAVSMTTTHFTIDFRSRLLPRFPRPPSARDHITPPKQLSLMFSQLISLAYRCAGFPPVTQGRSSSYLRSWPSKLRQNIASSLVTPPTPKIHHKERVAPPRCFSHRRQRIPGNAKKRNPPEGYPCPFPACPKPVARSRRRYGSFFGLR